MNITKINKYNKRTEQHFYNEDKKQVHSQIKIHLKNITKISKHKNLNYKVSRNKHTTDEDKNTKITKIDKYEKQQQKNKKTKKN